MNTQQSHASCKRIPVSGKPLEIPPAEILFDRGVPSSLELVPAFVERIISICADLGLFMTPEDRTNTTSCIEEAVRNAVIHGNKEDFKKEVRAQIFRGPTEWGIVVRDQGNGFAARADCPGSNGDEQSVGFGTAIIGHHMDRAEYFDGGRTLLMARTRLLKPVLANDEYQDLRCGGILEVELKDGALITRLLHSRVRDHKAINEALDKLLAYVAEHAKCSLVINLEKVEYLSSVAIGRCVAILKRVRSGGGDLRLCCPRGELWSVLQIMKLDKIMGVDRTEAEAINALCASSSAARE